MNTTSGLPETPFAPLAQARLEAMIDVALSHPQQHESPRVIALRRHPLMFGGSMAAMAASIMLAFMLTPVTGTAPVTVAANTVAANTADAGDVGDMLLYESLGA